MTDAERRCPVCGRRIPADTPMGLCTACMLAAGLTEDEKEAAALEPSPAAGFPDTLAPSDGERAGVRGYSEKVRAETADARPHSLSVRCPQCGHLIQLASGASLSSVHCDSCGTNFSVVDETAASQAAADLGQIGQFQILQKLGTGAFGTVWKARDTRLDRWVSIKIPRHRRLDPAEAEKFLREARAAAQLRHPNIVSVHEVGREADLIYIVCDFVEGVSLADWLTSHRLNPREAARLAAKLARALQHAHDAGVIHRDVKPQNILIDSAGEPHLTDFGLARREAGEVTLTLDGQLLGTPAYMSPEQARGEAHAADRRTDIYSLGAVLFQVLTGELPFRGNARMMLQQVVQDDPPSLRKLNAHVPRDLETITLKCLEKDPERRYATAGDLADELDRFANGEPIRARSVGPAGKAWRWCRRKPALAATTGIAVALLITVTVVSTVAAVRIAASHRTEERESYYALIGLAQSLVEQGEIDQAKEALLKCSPRFRHWEWGHLMFRCHQDVLSIPAHTDIKFDPMLLWSGSVALVQSVIFNHDSSQLASLGRDGSVKVWDVKDGHRLFALGGTNRPATALAFRPSAGQLATVFSDGAAEVWDTGVWQKQWDFRFETGKVEGFAYQLDGKRLALRGRNEIALCDVAAGAVVGHHRSEAPITAISFVSGGGQLLVRTEREAFLLDTERGPNSVGTDSTTSLEDNGDAVERVPTGTGMWHVLALPPAFAGSLFISPTADRFVTINSKGLVSLWTNSTAKIDLGEIWGAQPSGLRQVFFSEDGRRFCTGGESSSARVWDLDSGKELLAIPSKVYRAIFSPDGKRLVSIGSEKTVRVWDVERRSESFQLRGHSTSIETLAFSPDGSRLATGAHDGTVKLWSARPGREVLQEPSWIWGLSVSPDGRRIVDSGQEAGFTIWDAESGRRLVRVDTRVHEVTASSFSPDGRQVVTVGGDGLGRVWDANNGRLLLNLEGHTRTILAVAYAPTGEWIATGGQDGTARIWEASTGREIQYFNHGSNLILHVALSPDGRRLATVSSAKMTMWDVVSGRLLFQVGSEGLGLSQAVFSPDGRRVVLTGNVASLIWVYDARTGKLLGTWPSGVTGPLAFSGDGQRILVSGSGRDITYGLGEAYAQLWDFESSRRILTLKGHSEPIGWFLFAANDRRIVSGAFDMTVRQWETFPWREVEYPGTIREPFLDRARRFADEYWRKRLEAEAQPVEPIRSRLDYTVLWPKRDARAASVQLDLTELYNGALHAAFHPVFSIPELDNYLRELGSGLLELGGVRFDVRGVIQLRPHKDREPAWQYYWDLLPIRVGGIRVEQQVRQLQVLQATACTENSVKDGAEVARFVWHYDTGEESSPILYGRDVRDWWWRPEDAVEPTSARSRVVWTGSNPFAREKGYQLRLYLTTIENPRPDEVVRSFDYVSAMTESAPFLIAITLE